MPHDSAEMGIVWKTEDNNKQLGSPNREEIQTSSMVIISKFHSQSCDKGENACGEIG